jgi:hypothetical protein
LRSQRVDLRVCAPWLVLGHRARRRVAEPSIRRQLTAGMGLCPAPRCIVSRTSAVRCATCVRSCCFPTWVLLPLVPSSMACSTVSAGTDTGPIVAVTHGWRRPVKTARAAGSAFTRNISSCRGRGSRPRRPSRSPDALLRESRRRRTVARTTRPHHRSVDDSGAVRLTGQAGSQRGTCRMTRPALTCVLVRRIVAIGGSAAGTLPERRRSPCTHVPRSSRGTPPASRRASRRSVTR